MDWKAFFDVLDHLASHFGVLGRVKSWKKNFRFWISDFFRGWSGGTTVTEVGDSCAAGWEGVGPRGRAEKTIFFSLGSSHGPSPKFSVGASLAFARGFCPQGARIKLFFYKAAPVSLVLVSSLESIWPVSS